MWNSKILGITKSIASIKSLHFVWKIPNKGKLNKCWVVYVDKQIIQQKAYTVYIIMYYVMPNLATQIIQFGIGKLYTY